jgi:hypothetical protein
LRIERERERGERGREWREGRDLKADRDLVGMGNLYSSKSSS